MAFWQDQIDGCDAFLVVYSVVDKASFTRAEYFLSILQDMDLLRSRCCILVGNKIDLARSRAISSQGESTPSVLYIHYANLILHLVLRWKMFGVYVPSEVS